jgi:DNA-binding XRE family transcriptional regulator
MAEPRDRRHENTTDCYRRWCHDPDISAAHQRSLLRVGDVVNRLRVNQDWSIDQLAHACGLHRDTVGDLERAVSDPKLSTIVSLAYVFGFELDVRFVRPSTKAPSS